MSERLFNAIQAAIASNSLSPCEAHPQSTRNGAEASLVCGAGLIMIEATLQSFVNGNLKDDLPEDWVAQIYANEYGAYVSNHQLTFFPYHLRYYARRNEAKVYLQRIIDLQGHGLVFHLCHKCNKGIPTPYRALTCSRPSHLFLATQQINTRDIAAHAYLAQAQSDIEIQVIQNLNRVTGGAGDVGIPLSNLNTANRALMGANQDIYENDNSESTPQKKNG